MHVALLLLLLLAQRAVLDLGHGSFSSDEGAYALQVFAIGDGRWDIDDPFLDDGTDPPTTAFPNFTVQDGVVHPYVQHPAWPRLLAVADDLAGTTGAYAVTLLAGLAVPLLAWWAVGRLAPDAAGGWTPVVAFWAAALAPAALVSSSILWAHAPSAALAGVAVVLAVDRRRGLDLALAAAAVAGGVLLRSEGILVGLAVCAVLVGRGARRRDPGELLAAAVIGAAAGVALLIERAWQDAILGGPLEAAGVRGESTGRGFLVDRFDGVLHSLVGSRYELDGSVLLLGGVVVLAAAIAALGVDSGDGRRAAVGSWVAVGCLAFVWLLRPDLPYTGLLVVWPVAVAGAVGLARAAVAGPQRAERRHALRPRCRPHHLPRRRRRRVGRALLLAGDRAPRRRVRGAGRPRPGAGARGAPSHHCGAGRGRARRGRFRHDGGPGRPRRRGEVERGRPRHRREPSP